eukprot:982606-Rhodomonas_salina.1
MGLTVTSATITGKRLKTSRAREGRAERGGLQCSSRSLRGAACGRGPGRRGRGQLEAPSHWHENLKRPGENLKPEPDSEGDAAAEPQAEGRGLMPCQAES